MLGYQLKGTSPLNFKFRGLYYVLTRHCNNRKKLKNKQCDDYRVKLHQQINKHTKLSPRVIQTNYKQKHKKHLIINYLIKVSIQTIKTFISLSNFPLMFSVRFRQLYVVVICVLRGKPIVTIHRLCLLNNTTGVSSGARLSKPSGAKPQLMQVLCYSQLNY